MVTRRPGGQRQPHRAHLTAFFLCGFTAPARAAATSWHAYASRRADALVYAQRHLVLTCPSDTSRTPAFPPSPAASYTAVSAGGVTARIRPAARGLQRFKTPVPQVSQPESAGRQGPAVRRPIGGLHPGTDSQRPVRMSRRTCSLAPRWCTLTCYRHSPATRRQASGKTIVELSAQRRRKACQQGSPRPP